MYIIYVLVHYCGLHKYFIIPILCNFSSYKALQPRVGFGLLHTLPPDYPIFHFLLHHVVFIFLRSISTSSFHLFFGLPFDLVPSGFQLIIILTLLLSAILTTWMNHLIHWDLANFTISSPLIISSFVLILQYPLGSCIKPYIFLIILHSNILSFSSSAFVKVQLSHPYVTTGLINDL